MQSSFVYRSLLYLACAKILFLFTLLNCFLCTSYYVSKKHLTRAVARTEMGGFCTYRFVENGFYLKRVSLSLGNLENGLKPGITRVNFKKMGLKKPG